MTELTRPDGYLLSTDPLRLDLDLVHHWLSTDTYWGVGRDRETVGRAFAGSTPFGIYRPGDGRQVAVGRVITDGALFGYLCDVYVDRAERGRGLGTWLATSAREHLTALGVRRVLLTTLDAQEVYARIGFLPVPARQWMEYATPVSPLTSKDQEPAPPLTVAE